MVVQHQQRGTLSGVRRKGERRRGNGNPVPDRVRGFTVTAQQCAVHHRDKQREAHGRLHGGIGRGERLPGAIQIATAHPDLTQDEEQPRVSRTRGDETLQQSLRCIDPAKCHQAVDQLQQHLALRLIQRVCGRPVRNPVAGGQLPG